MLNILFSSELHGLGSRGEGAESRLCILEIEDFRIVVLRIIHGAKFRISLQHRLLGLYAVVVDQLARKAQISALGFAASCFATSFPLPVWI